MELKLENDFLALVNADRYQELKDQAAANENTQQSAIETTLQIATGAIIVGAVGYMGYALHTTMKEGEKRNELRREKNDLAERLAELKRKTEKE